jgi:hypothetical protein
LHNYVSVPPAPSPCSDLLPSTFHSCWPAFSSLSTLHVALAIPPSPPPRRQRTGGLRIRARSDETSLREGKSRGNILVSARWFYQMQPRLCLVHMGIPARRPTVRMENARTAPPHPWYKEGKTILFGLGLCAQQGATGCLLWFSSRETRSICSELLHTGEPP